MSSTPAMGEGHTAPSLPADPGHVAGQKHPLPTRVSRACERCRRHKSRCDPHRPCSLCERANVPCISDPEDVSKRPIKQARHTRTLTSPSLVQRTSPGSVTEPIPHHRIHRESTSSLNHPTTGHVDDDSAMGMARSLYRLGRRDIDESAVTAIPGGEPTDQASPSSPLPLKRYPISELLKHPMPQSEIITSLLEEYFSSIHWFSLVVYEPIFRSAYQCVQDGFAALSHKPFILLLSTMLGLAAWYKAHKPSADGGFDHDFWKDWSSKLIKNAEAELIEILDSKSIPTVQTLTLLGSFYVYHGRPNLSFSLLGACIRVAQALSLHQESSQFGSHEQEERKRIWWTIYTWDGFASVTYGRPLAIQECTISMPQDVIEDIRFSASPDALEDHRICFSTYQRELNKLYMIASPAIKDIYNNHSDTSKNAYMELVQDVTARLWQWRSALPPQLLHHAYHDCPLEMTQTAKAHTLQALALQLTFDNLLIILHRPFIAQRIHSLQQNPSLAGTSTDPQSRHQAGGTPAQTSRPQSGQAFSAQEWWEAAVRISRVTELPHLAQLATDSHLVTFLAINLFNSAIAMAVMALSDPLSDRAQETKRAITRIFRLQELFGRRSILSMQSSAVLRNVIHLLLRREAEAVLDPLDSERRYTAPTTRRNSSFYDQGGMSVTETLNMPLGNNLWSTNNRPETEMPDAATRLHESLASVQKAFTVNSSRIQGYGQAHPTQETFWEHTPDGVAHEDNWQGIGAPVYHDINSDDAMRGFGGFVDNNNPAWFWDPTWDG